MNNYDGLFRGFSAMKLGAMYAHLLSKPTLTHDEARLRDLLSGEIEARNSEHRTMVEANAGKKKNGRLLRFSSCAIGEEMRKQAQADYLYYLKKEKRRRLKNEAG